jgi:23S rRNA-/tRNA-specific pseudouridylate synthase
VEKKYIVRIMGHPPDDIFFSDAPISLEPDLLGSRYVDELDGLPSRTDFQVIKRCTDNTTLLEAKLGTGRTNQIRVHLWQLGYPVVGDATYLSNHQIGDTQTLSLGDPPLQLHAWKLSLRNPLSGEIMNLEASRPVWSF